MKKSSTPKKHKGKVVVSLAVLILGSAVFLNWYFANSDVSKTITPLLSNEKTTSAVEDKDVSKNLGEASYVGATEKKESEYFTKARMERQKARDSALEELNKVVSNSAAGEQAQQKAAEGVEKISKDITAENKIETLVKAKKVKNCLAVIGQEKVEVIVEADELTDALILQIKEIVMNQTKTSYENISIIESK